MVFKCELKHGKHDFSSAFLIHFLQIWIPVMRLVAFYKKCMLYWKKELFVKG